MDHTHKPIWPSSKNTAGLNWDFYCPFFTWLFSTHHISFTLFAVALALLEDNKMFGKVMLMVVIGGLLTWVWGRSANHIGAHQV